MDTDRSVFYLLYFEFLTDIGAFEFVDFAGGFGKII